MAYQYANGVWAAGANQDDFGYDAGKDIPGTKYKNIVPRGGKVLYGRSYNQDYAWVKAGDIGGPAAAFAAAVNGLLGLGVTASVYMRVGGAAPRIDASSVRANAARAGMLRIDGLRLVGKRHATGHLEVGTKTFWATMFSARQRYAQLDKEKKHALAELAMQLGYGPANPVAMPVNQFLGKVGVSALRAMVGANLQNNQLLKDMRHNSPFAARFGVRGKQGCTLADSIRRNDGLPRLTLGNGKCRGTDPARRERLTRAELNDLRVSGNALAADFFAAAGATQYVPRLVGVLVTKFFRLALPSASPAQASRAKHLLRGQPRAAAAGVLSLLGIDPAWLNVHISRKRDGTTAYRYVLGASEVSADEAGRAAALLQLSLPAAPSADAVFGSITMTTMPQAVRNAMTGPLAAVQIDAAVDVDAAAAADGTAAPAAAGPV